MRRLVLLKTIRFIIIIVTLTILTYALYVFAIYNIFHPIKKLTANEIDSVKISGIINGGMTYKKPEDTQEILHFLSMYNKAKLNWKQELDTTSDFTIDINLANGDIIHILDGDTSYCYIHYKDKRIIAYAPALVKHFENIKAIQNRRVKGTVP